ncbi:MAG: TRAP transporter small permease [Oceanospirillaceae bacterium]|nr:TRAP transporter small permease [Oceanospirillaceae bacterium]
MFTALLQKLCFAIDKTVMFSGKTAALLMPILAFVVAYEVFSRYLFDSPTIWAFDLSLFLFGYIAALGGAYAQQRRAHINVDILYNRVPPKVRSAFNLLTFSLAIFFLVLIIAMSLGKYEEAIEFNYRRQSEWAPPMFHFWVMMIVASSLFIAQLGRDLISEIYFIFTRQVLLAQEHRDGH